MRFVVETPGTRLSFDQGILIVENQQEQKITEIPFLHITSLHIHPKVRISTDVMLYCIQSGIPIFLEDNIQTKGLIWSPNYGSISIIRKKQTLLSFSSLKWTIIKKAISRKNQERIAHIRRLTRKQEILSKIEQIKTFDQKLQQAQTPETIRSAEALAGKTFFEIYAMILPKNFNFQTRNYPNAKDPVNILLNYGYGVLYNEVTKSLIQSGLDPYIGFFHRDQYNRPAFTYDMVEPYRPWIEFQNIKFLKSLSGNEKILNPQNRLHTEIRKKYLQHLFTFLDKTSIKWNQKHTTPRNHIRRDMQAIATYIKNINHETLFNTLRHQ